MKSVAIVYLLMAVAGYGVYGQEVPVNGIEAIVGDKIITYQEAFGGLGEQEYLLRVQYSRQPAVRDQKLKDLYRERVEDLVARQLILMDFTNAGYNLPESFLDDRVQEDIRKKYVGDRAQLMKTLKEEGVSYEKYRQRIREDIIISFLLDKHLNQQLIISPQKIEDYYRTNLASYKMDDQVKLRMIAVTRDKAAPEVASKMAGEILRKLESGTPFDEMAAVYSDGSRRFTTGDWVERKELRNEIASAAFGLKKGQHSKVIETADACYLILVEDARPAHTRPLTEVRDEIEKILLTQERNRLRKNWIDRLKNKAFVRFFG